MIYLPIKARNKREHAKGWQEQKGREVCSYNCSIVATTRLHIMDYSQRRRIQVT